MPVTNPTAGQVAIVQINNTTYQTTTGIKTADIQIATDIYDITDLNSNNWKLKLPGLNDYTLKLAGNFDMSDAQQALLQANVITTPGTLVQWKVYPQGTGGGNKAYAGSAYLKGINPKIDVKAENQISFDLEGTGAITYS